MVARIVDTFARVLPEAIDEGIFVLGPDFPESVRDQLRAICEARGMKASFAIQYEALGTGHAVYAATEYLSGSGVIVFADTLFDMDPLNDLGDADVIAWVKIVDDPSRFGVAVREGDRVVGFVEKPKELISKEALIGIYYVADLGEMNQVLADLINDERKSHRGEYELTDAMDDLLKRGKIFHTASVSEWLDCGTIPALMDTTWRILEKESDGIKGRLDDCTIIEPVYIAPGAHAARSVLGPNVSLEEGAVVEDSVLSRTIVFSNGRVSDSRLEDSLVGQFAEVKGQVARANIGDHSTLEPV
jgi:glucose-1-phosphate thymidylyltransferase